MLPNHPHVKLNYNIYFLSNSIIKVQELLQNLGNNFQQNKSSWQGEATKQFLSKKRKIYNKIKLPGIAAHRQTMLNQSTELMK